MPSNAPSVTVLFHGSSGGSLRSIAVCGHFEPLSRTRILPLAIYRHETCSVVGIVQLNDDQSKVGTRNRWNGKMVSFKKLPLGSASIWTLEPTMRVVEP